MPYLYILNGRAQFKVFRLEGKPEESYVIGQRDDGDLQVRDPWISWTHARVFRDGQSWAIEDLGSTNGTYVNCERVTRRTLAEDDVIFLGRTHVLFVASDRAPSAPPPGAGRSGSSGEGGHVVGELTGRFRSPFAEVGPIEELEVRWDDLALPPAATIAFIGPLSCEAAITGRDAELDESRPERVVPGAGDPLPGVSAVSDDHIEIDIEEPGLRAPGSSTDPGGAISVDLEAPAERVARLEDEVARLRAAVAEREAEVRRLREEVTRLKEQYLDL